MSREDYIKHSVFNELWTLKKAYVQLNEGKYRIVSRSEWDLESPEYMSEVTVIEGRILYVKVKGNASDESIAKSIEQVNRVAEMFGLQAKGYALIIDTTKLDSGRSKLLQGYRLEALGSVLYNIVTKSSARLSGLFLRSVEGVTISASLDSVVAQIKNQIWEKSEQERSENNDQRIDQLFDWISKSSFSKGEALAIPEIPVTDPFYKVFQALELLNEDKNSLLDTLSESQEKLDVRNASLRAIFKNSSLLIGMLNDQYEFIDFNRKLNDHFSKLGHMLVKGTKIGQYLTEKERQVFYKQQLEIKNGESTEVETKVTYLDGSHAWFRTKMFPVYVEGDKIYSAFVSEDVTTQYTLRDEQKKILMNLKAQNDVLKSLNHKVAHELNHHAASITQLLAHYSDKDLTIDNKVDFVMNLQDLLGKLNDTIEDINDVTHSTEDQSFISKVVLSDDPEVKRKLGNIMLVDDDNITNVMNEHLIKKKIGNCVVSKFLKGQEALKALMDQKEKPDVVLLDINMPDIDGWDFLEVLMKSNVNVEVHMLTSSKNPEEREKALKYPIVKSFLNKPLNVEKIEKLAG